MWGLADSIVTDMPSPFHWGWTKRGEVWTPQWTTQLAVWQASENYLNVGARRAVRQIDALVNLLVSHAH